MNANTQDQPRATGQVAHRPGANAFADFYAYPSPAKAVSLALADYQERSFPSNPPAELWTELAKARDICNSYAADQARIKGLESALEDCTRLLVLLNAPGTNDPIESAVFKARAALALGNEKTP